MVSENDSHDFVVTDVQLAQDQSRGLAIDLTDKRGGQVRLHLSLEMAQRLGQAVSAAMTAREAE